MRAGIEPIRVAMLAAGASLALLAGAAAPAAAQQQGSHCAGATPAELSAPYVIRLDISPADYLRDFTNSGGLVDQGFRPLRTTGYSEGAPTRYMTKWIKATGPEIRSEIDMTGGQFDKRFEARRKDYRPVDISAYNTLLGPRFAVTWLRNATNTGWKIHRRKTRGQMQDLVDDYAKQGFVPRRVEAYQGDGLRFASVWVKASCAWKMHNKMSRGTYQLRLDTYAALGYKLLHLDSYRDDGDTWFAGIWTKNSLSAPEVRSDRPWYTFLRSYNSARCNGREIENFYITTIDGTLQHGGIFRRSATPLPTLSSPFGARLEQEVDCAPGRAGAAVIDVTANTETHVNGTANYGTSSTIKSAILYTLLRRVDASATDNITLDSLIAAGGQYGNNQGNRVTALQLYTLRQFATFMIQNSNNWATNRLIQYLGFARFRAEMDRLGLNSIRLRRFMTGDGAPSAHGEDDSGDDYEEGFDNTATPLQYARFLRRMHTGGDLTAASNTFFWNTLALNSGAHNGATLTPGGVAPAITLLEEKAGSNTWSDAPENKPELGPHLQRSAAGRVTLTDGRVLIYAAFVDEADQLPNLQAGQTAIQTVLDCVVLEAVRAGIATSSLAVGSVSTAVPACQGE